ncbi:MULTISPECIES: mechanosensitive channel MscK [Edwardsiella]|uniref:Potassium efflux system KefA protein / Small-conductance mechanosensitive channel n=2 Tax=Edwardsiella anguillarum TaxID=1821960 RepID=A0A076LRU0_9GAMM|nr:MULTISPECIES: mechanosensitive channel MscK [Edwardsiella]AIJ09387.1 Potassium efflux system KefA protein / Small-conductance mechanosensitive channel [Edwardsiella anguillarum ET080813]AKR77210.1 mechanosensitive channel MscK [Edwardsiella sp. LADL05-105]KAB0590430.1 mechanosensitive channel MscK [Edwardsiella anguillarum]UOU80084.1 mechanosensitive channel MscK [Edwardsiella anguillarum]WHP84892.1 mechanosensitive channel MscK [Edwardsiella anguillarum]
MTHGVLLRPGKGVALWRVIIVTLLLSLLFCSAFARAQSGDIDSRTEVQNQIDALNRQKSLSASDKLVLQDLNQTLEYLDGIERYRKESQQLKQQVQQAPGKLNQALAGLEALQRSSDAADEANFSAMSTRQLQSQWDDTLAELKQAQDDLASYSSQLIALQTQPERAQASMMASSQQIQQIRNTLAEGTQLRASQRNMLNTELAMLNQSLDYQQQSLGDNTTLQDVLQKQRDYASARITKLERSVQLIRQAGYSKQLIQSEKTAREAINPDDAAQDFNHNPLIAKELEINRALSQRLIDATEKTNTLVQENIRVKNWLDRSLQAERNLKEQISVLKGSLLLSRILYQQQQKLPTEKLSNDVAAQVADLRVAQFDINAQRDALSQSSDYVAALQADSKEKLSDEAIAALEDLVDTRRDLLDKLNKQLGSELTLAISLQINQQQLRNVNDYLQHTLTQQIFWVSSNKPMNLAWFIGLPAALHTQAANLHIDFKPAQLLEGFISSLYLFIPLLIGTGLLLWRRRAINARLDKLGDEVGQLKRDGQLHTPEAILLNILRGLPGTLLLLAVGVMFYHTETQIGGLLWVMSLRFALFWLIISTTYRLISPGGISERHFNVSPLVCAHYRRMVRRLGFTLIPLMVWCVIGEKSPLQLNEDVIGQVVILITLALLTVFVFPLCRDAWREKNSHSVRLVLVTLLAIAPLILMILTACGYFYTALRLGTRWIESLYLMLLWAVVYSTVLRGLSVAARRLAYRRALARRQQNAAGASREGAEGLEAIEEPPLAIDQINTQSLRLTTMVLFLIFGCVLYWIWADLFTVISYLDSITLWHYNSGSGASQITQAVTLGNLLFAMMTVVVAYIMMRNLPGLLEVLVLSRLQLRQGASYAITTILTYAIISVGVIIFFGSLGISWDKLQWMAAALSVGLGFGLNEIFGNFIAGLIILFERPVRIGDTITIGSYSGSVNKIRIRATTITDFDRKEVIIPNKAFVTERLINWSLTDTVTRVLIKVGVAYGSDLDKVREILLQAAGENPRVMVEPEPQVFFLTFGASTLDHEMRLYVRELRDRSYVVDELNRRIDQLCRENDINIAFNQLEVYLHNPQGNEVQEVKRTLTDPPPDSLRI